MRFRRRMKPRGRFKRTFSRRRRGGFSRRRKSGGARPMRIGYRM